MPASPTVEELVERLAKHKTLGSAPREQLHWIASRARYITAEPDDVLMRKDEPVDDLWIMLTGQTAIRLTHGTVTRKIVWYGGDVAGQVPYSRLQTSPGVITAEEPTEYLLVNRSHFMDLIRDCHEVTTLLIHSMLDRTRAFNSIDIHGERLQSLGRLSAGLAHELNNPASAVARSAEALTTRLDEVEKAFRALGALRLSESQMKLVDEVTNICMTTNDPVRSPVERSDREDEFADWLNDHGADEKAAEALAETAVAIEGLDRLAEILDGDALDITLSTIASSCAVWRLATEIESAAARVHALVKAVKGFTRMDQAGPEPVDVARGLSDTLMVLRPKAREKRVGLAINIPADLPKIQGYGGELNQVWMNLIDNALDAVSEHGKVEVSAGVKSGKLVVKVIDDGPGIPPEIRNRIFEPFFTTKGVGEGTGLGLDTVRRVVAQHDGSVEPSSEPGRTEFIVELPLPSPA